MFAWLQGLFRSIASIFDVFVTALLGALRQGAKELGREAGRAMIQGARQELLSY